MGEISEYMVVLVLGVTALGLWKRAVPLIWGSGLLFIYLGFKAHDTFLMIVLMGIGLLIFVSEYFRKGD